MLKEWRNINSVLWVPCEQKLLPYLKKLKGRVKIEWIEWSFYLDAILACWMQKNTTQSILEGLYFLLLTIGNRFLRTPWNLLSRRQQNKDRTGSDHPLKLTKWQKVIRGRVCMNDPIDLFHRPTTWALFPLISWGVEHGLVSGREAGNRAYGSL